MHPTCLFLIRHGETEWTRQGRYQGQSDIPLNKTGKQQALCLARRVKKFEVDVLYSSPLKRAWETAQAVRKVSARKIVKDKRLQELGFGRWEGKTAAELTEAKDAAFLKWCRGEWVRPQNAESLVSLRKRVRGFLTEMTSARQGKKVAVISHGGFIKMLIMNALGMPVSAYGFFQIRPASLSVLELYQGAPRLIALNDVCHLSGVEESI